VQTDRLDRVADALPDWLDTRPDLERWQRPLAVPRCAAIIDNRRIERMTHLLRLDPTDLWRRYVSLARTRPPTRVPVSAKVITSALVSASMMRWVRAAVRSCVEPGSAGAIHASRPAGSAMTWALTPGQRCLPA